MTQLDTLVVDSTAYFAKGFPAGSSFWFFAFELQAFDCLDSVSVWV